EDVRVQILYFGNRPVVIRKFRKHLKQLPPACLGVLSSIRGDFFAAGTQQFVNFLAARALLKGLGKWIGTIESPFVGVPTFPIVMKSKSVHRPELLSACFRTAHRDENEFPVHIRG